MADEDKREEEEVKDEGKTAAMEGIQHYVE